jgi:hypothetical protein
MFEMNNKNVIVTRYNDEMKQYFKNIVDDIYCDDVSYNTMCNENIDAFFKNNAYMHYEYTLIKNDDILHIIVFNNNEFKIVSYKINDDFEFIRFNVSYVYNVYDLFSIIFN